MQTYVILRRGGGATAADLEEAAARSIAEGDAMSFDSSVAHSYRGAGSSACTAIVVTLA